jgi:hypothetical protein
LDVGKALLPYCAALVSPTIGYLARRLPHATWVLEPLPALHLTARLDADGRAAPGLLRAIPPTHAPGCAPWLGPHGPVSVVGCALAALPQAGISSALFIIFNFEFIYLFQEIILNFSNSYKFVDKSEKYKINFYIILKSKSVQ